MLGRLLLTSAGLLACSPGLPQIAQPRTPEASELSSNPEDHIRYRKLERSDFQRKTPPAVYKEGPLEIGAQTCAGIHSNRDLLVRYQPNADGQFEGWFEKLGFYADMDRACSWWNPKSKDETYVLQHEQIHFALHEIEVRRMNREAKETMRELRVTAATDKEVLAKMQAELQEIVERHSEDVNERNQDFDEDTSVGHNPKKQQEWFELVERELRELEAYR